MDVFQRAGELAVEAIKAQRPSTDIRFAPEGADVTVADIDANAGRETAGLIADHDVDVEFAKTDVVSTTAVENLMQTTVGANG
jgi:NAD(P)-dependent dehydrogenase (short-subunit alcohol dehydrogenase family)